MKKFVYQNNLSLVFVLLFVGALTGQILFGIKEYNRELEGHGTAANTMQDYLLSGHFMEYTFENGESGFLQMGLLVWLTILLMQIGSTQSKQHAA